MTLYELTEVAGCVCSPAKLFYLQSRMPCSISDGPQEPEDVNPDLWPEEDEDEAYERERQQRIDDLNRTLEDISRSIGEYK